MLDEDDILFARALKDQGNPMNAIVKKLTIKTGKNAGRHPSLASLYRARTPLVDSIRSVGAD